MAWGKDADKLLEDIHDVIYSYSDFDKAVELINNFV